MVHIFSISILKAPSSGAGTLLASASDLSSFSFFQRGSIAEFMPFFSKTVAERTPQGQRQSVQENNYTAHVYNRGGPEELAAVIITDQEYPVRPAFSLLAKVLDDFVAKIPKGSWDDPAKISFPELESYLSKYQDPRQADTIMRVQAELDETKIVLHKTIESVLQRGEKLDTLVDRSNHLSAQSKMFYKTAKKVPISKFCSARALKSILSKIAAVLSCEPRLHTISSTYQDISPHSSPCSSSYILPCHCTYRHFYSHLLIMSFHTLHPEDLDQHIRTSPLALSDLPGYFDALEHFSSIDDRKFLLENMVTLMSRISGSSIFSSLSRKLQDTLIDIPNAPYARSVPASNITPPASLPSAGLVFDTLLARDEFTPHPGGISALFFAFADLIIHSIFNTNHADPTVNATSSYLDLSILYGNSQKEQDTVRCKDGRGGLYADCFADSRLLHMPPAVCSLLVVLSRNHNASRLVLFARNADPSAQYTAQKILEINERGIYKTSFANDAEKLAQDDEIFNRARLVNCGYFMQIILGDYVGAILGLVRDGYSWRLDPLSQSREANHELSPRGEGNVVSIEFNLLYRWHATLSEQDTAWTENMFKDLFDGQDFSTLTIEDFMRVAHTKLIPDRDPREWTFDGLVRGADGRFKDSDLATILQNSTSWRAGAYKARGIPEVLRVIEVLGIEQARRWGACSMNDFRRFLGLKPYASFQEWNSDKSVHTAAASLYNDIENLELYVGLQAEEAKPPMPGAGLCPGYTISRSILADAVCLTRGDRFLTIEFTPWNLTAWGFRDCQFDAQDGSYGGMLTKLLFRTLPEYYPRRSAYAHFPFLDPAFMQNLMAENNKSLVGEYIWTKPEINVEKEAVLVVKTESAVREVLADQTVFPNGYADRVMEVTGHSTVDHTFVNDLLLKENAKWTEYFVTETRALIAQLSFGNVSKKVQYIDIVRDVINVLPVHWICKEIAGLPLGENVQTRYHAFADVCQYIFLNYDPSSDWHLRESAKQAFHEFDKVVKNHLGSRISLLDMDRSSLAESLPFLTELKASADRHHLDLNELSVALFVEVVTTAAHWSQGVTHIINYYLDERRVEERAEIVKADGKKAMDIVGLRWVTVDPPVWGVYRTAHKDENIVESTKVPLGGRVFASIKDASAGMEKPLLGIGEHGLVSAPFFESTVPRVVSEILRLKDLKRAPGTSGVLNRFTESVHGAAQQWYIDSKSDVVPFPQSLVVEYSV
ncbi:unnamed protein product [Mycena citricolor]|uniref:Uncharacterized protein n=1 Tax=Mycena citricolor TaxID=2018698 RepID=A0AAD2HG50_9AGAR|nr:unnamed protein product [Mycena citricolor]